MKKETLFSLSKKIIKTERHQSEFLKAVNDLPVLCLGSKLSISVTDGKADIAEYTRINNFYSFNTDGNNDVHCPVDPHTDLHSPNITAANNDRGNKNHPTNKSSSLATSNISGSSSQLPFSKVASLTPGVEYDLKFSIDLLHGNSKASVFCPRYHRSKVASYWCVVGMQGRVLAVKKIIFSGTRVNVVIPVMLPGLAAVTVAGINSNGVNTKVVNPNDKLYMNYDDDYKQLQQQQQLLKEKDTRERQNQRQKTIQIYLISDSIMGLDDVVDLPILS